MKRLLIGTVFTDNECKADWCKIQQSFIARTTSNYHLIACLNRMEEASGYEVIHVFNDPKPIGVYDMSNEHCRGLNILIDYFRNHSSYSHLLILDSDCFPINNVWQKCLFDSIKRKNKSGAAVIRLENLTIFPHPCVLLIGRDILGESWFNIEVGYSTNLFSEIVSDTCASLPTDRFYPLIRTNEWNPHPLFFAIYADMFYHHGCGSRNLHFRSSEYYPKKYDVDKYWDEFFNSPEQFVSKLRGSDVGRFPIGFFNQLVL